jgi:hypothetical protein
LLADRDIAGNVSNPRLAIREVRSAPTGQEIPFTVRPVTVYENVGYDAVTTLVVEWGEAKAVNSAPSPKAKTVLCCELLKQHRQLSYEALSFHLEDAASFRAFARLPLSWTPKKSVLHMTISATRAKTWEAPDKPNITNR